MRRLLIILGGMTLIASMMALGSFYLPQANADDAAIQSAYTRKGQHPEKLVIKTIDGAQSTLDIAIYSLTYTPIIDAIDNAITRGVTVRILTDKTEMRQKNQAAALERLKNDGAVIKYNTHIGLMHLKQTIADNSIVVTGSYNYSLQATKNNDEVAYRIADSTIATAGEDAFQTAWDDTDHYADY